MEQYLLVSPWPGVCLWILLYISDYYLTLRSAKGFKEINRFQFEGSFELTPQYQGDIDALRSVSRRHILLLAACSLLIVLLWWLFNWLSDLQAGLMSGYLFCLGMFLLLEVAVHVRHFKNIFLIREIQARGGAEGRIEYRRWFSYKVSAFDLYTFGGLFLLTAILTYSLFFLGGAFACVRTGLRHGRHARQARLAAAASATAASGASG